MNPLFRRTKALLAPLAGLCLAIAPISLGVPAVAAERSIISAGHVDLGPRFVDGKWTFQIRDDNANPPAWRNLNELVLSIPASAKITVPEGDAFGFLGQAGDSIFVLPQVQKNGIVWPGWNTQDRSVVDGIPGEVTWRIDQVTGPGTMHL
ncbi:MAG: choice-of-anchor M domain-containing protein, partial [Angustibacter sp.]